LGPGFRIKGEGFQIQGSWFRVIPCWFMVQGLGDRVGVREVRDHDSGGLQVLQ
jgi:hypothetical protein